MLSDQNQTPLLPRDRSRTRGRAPRFLLFLLLIISSAAGAQETDRPNVLWITIEDTSPQFIGAYGNPDVHTPNFDRLASEGVRFTQAFAPAPVCAITRSALITGVSPNKLGTGHHRSGYPTPEYIRGYPAYLRDVGYYTTNNSKTDYNTSRAKVIIAESWDESSNKAGWWNRAPGQPFFSVFNFSESHQSRTMTNPRAWYEERVLANLPDSLVTSAENLKVPPIYRDSPDMRDHLARVYNSINYMDYRVGELLERLEADGLTDSTIIFFYADHGEAVPGGKATATGLGYRVPFVIWMPDAYRDRSPWPHGSVSDELVGFLDLGPTVISLGGGTIPDYMDGRAMLGPARSPAPDYLFAGRNRLDETPDLARSVTDGRYLYTRNFMPQYPAQKPQKYADVSDIVRTIRADDKAGLLSEPQARILRPQPAETLFDLTADPWERTNLIGDPAHAARHERMRQTLHGHILEQRDVLFLPEAELAELEMPFTYRMDRERYPLDRALETALLDARDDDDAERLREDLESPESLVRYWAAIALSRYAPSEASVRALQRVLDDEHPSVAIEAAGGLVRHTPDAGDAAAVLREFALGEEPYRALSALQKMQFAGDAMRDFLPTFRQKLEQMGDDTNRRGMSYPIRSSATTSIFLLGEGPLSY